jgi:hypothetical protein
MNPLNSACTRRSNRSVKWLFCLLFGGYMMTSAITGLAMEIEEWRFRTSLFTQHWSENPNHNDTQKLINFDFVTTKNWIYGFAAFDNSFGQPSQYVYAGYSWDLFGTDWAYVQVSGGLLHGYKEPYEDKIPFNSLGIAPAIVPSFGVRYKRVFSEIQILGGAAVTWTAGFSFGGKKYKGGKD